MRLLIFGLGYTGTALARAAAQAGLVVDVATRQAGATPHELRVLAMTQEAPGEKPSSEVGEEIEAGVEARRETVTSSA